MDLGQFSEKEAPKLCRVQVKLFASAQGLLRCSAVSNKLKSLWSHWLGSGFWKFPLQNCLKKPFVSLQLILSSAAEYVVFFRPLVGRVFIKSYFCASLVCWKPSLFFGQSWVCCFSGCNQPLHYSVGVIRFSSDTVQCCYWSHQHPVDNLL